jgi:hypothetical protein
MVILAYNKKLKIKEFIKSNNTTYTTFHNWVCKYNDIFIKNIPMTASQFKSINTQYLHRSNKRSQYADSIIQYVNNNNGCSLDDIKNNVTNNNLSFSSICRVLKENNINASPRKKIINKIVCKDIDKIIKERHEYKEFINESYFDYISVD